MSDFSPSRDFKGIWIPKEIWLDQNLTYFEKCLLAEIHSLDGSNGCYASNEYLCNFFNERERKIQDALAKLKARGYVYVLSFDGRTRILKTNLNPNSDKSLFSTPDLSKIDTPDLSKIDTPPGNTYIIEKKDLEKRQQQAAAVSSEKNKQHIYECLLKEDFPEPEKIALTREFSQDDVLHAINAANHQKEFKNSRIAFVKWACKAKPEIIKTPEEIIHENQKLARKVEKNVRKSPYASLYLSSIGAEICFHGAQKEPLFFSFHEKDFPLRFKEVLKRYQLDFMDIDDFF